MNHVVCIIINHQEPAFHCSINGICTHEYNEIKVQLFISCTIILYYRHYALAYGKSYFGAGTGTIAFGKLECTGFELDLIHCPHNLSSTCNHNEDAGVRCSKITAVH